MLLARNGANPLQKVDHNLLALSCESKGTGVLYVPALRRPHAERIMVDTKLEDRIESMFVGEEQIYNETTGKYSRAENLNTIYTKDELAVSSKIWANYEMKSFGDPQNALAQASSTGTSVVSSVARLKPNENMGLLEQARVHEWTKNIDVRADPTQPISSPALSEPEMEEPTSLRVVAKSESDDEEERPAEETTHRVVAQDSDDELENSIRTSAQSPARHSAQDSQLQLTTREGPSTDGKRARRADRYQADVPAFRGGPLPKASLGLVAADAFFANVPRDKDAHGEGRFQTTSPPDQQISSIDRTPEQKHIAQTGLPRRFGLDGAVDEPCEGRQQPTRPAYEQSAPDIARNTQTHHRTLSSELKGEYKSGPGFDPNKYGADRRPGRNEPGRRYATHPTVFPSNANHSDPVSTWPRAPASANMNSSYQRRNDYQFQQRRGQEQLVDYSDDEERRPTSMLPPPGLSPTRSSAEYDTTKPFHLLDAPLDDIQRPSIRPSWDGAPVPIYDEPSVSTSISSGNRTTVFEYNVQTKINKPDIGYIRNDRLSQLKSSQGKQKVKKTTESVAGQSPQRIDPVDEASTRKFFSTMNLKAPNPGKGKKGKAGSNNAAGGETAAQKAARIAKTKAELGLILVPARKTEAPTQQVAPEKLSKRAQQAAKLNPRMGQLHADSLQESSRKHLAREIVQRMKTPFELARMFPGYVEFEFQVGQLLTMPTSKIRPNAAMESERWKMVFDNGVYSAEVFFTNLLTCCGSDADGILEARAEGSKVWNKDMPGRCAVILEFDCRDSSGTEFTLHLNLDGTYSTTKSSFVLQQVGLQCPGRTWDTCAVLKGTPVWHNIPEELQSSIGELVSSVHVKAGYQVDLYFKTPSDNSLTVREVVVKKFSKHDSQLSGEEDLQLRIVESKTLYMTGHKKDKRLNRCSEKEHGTMSQDDRVHYGVSIVDRTIRTKLKGNKTIQAGGATSTEPTQLFEFNRALCIVRSALRLVDKIDWVGGHNIGTIVQRQYVRAKKEEEAAKSIPPSIAGHSFLRPVHSHTGMTVAGPRSVVGTRTVVASTMNGMTPVPVHGIRSGTSAQIVTDGMGNYFRLGLGGARIPLDMQEESSLVGDGVVPDDSASQVGAARRQPMRRIDERPEGFW